MVSVQCCNLKSHKDVALAKVGQMSDFRGTAGGESPQVTMSDHDMHSLIDAVLINAYKLMVYFIDNDTGQNSSCVSATHVRDK